MKANELMIGDWYRNQEYSEDLQWKIDDYIITNAKYCEPVPITEEMLNANGFCQVGESFTLRTGHIDEFGNPYTIVVRGGSPAFDMIVYISNYTDGDPDWILPDFQYVHELQRALRCCGLFELADNFKLE